MDEAERRRMDVHEASGLLPRLRAHVRSFCAPIWWETGRNKILANGTMCAVRTPMALFGVTNNHVLKIYERQKAQDADVFCQLGSGPFDPVENLISRSERWDLATFHIPALTLAHWGGRVYQDSEWPPAPIKQGDTVMLGGFPESRRAQPAGERPQQMLNDFFTMHFQVGNSCSDEHFAHHFDSSTWYFPQGTSLEPHPNLSGASGGPCFRLDGVREEAQLAGFIYEGTPEFELIYVRQASLIAADGTIAP